jgi:hypothetical protein
MPEIDNNQAAGAGASDNANAGEGQGSGSDQNKDTTATNIGNEDAGAGEGEGGEGADKDTSKGDPKDKNAKAPEKGQDNDDDDGEDPPLKPRLSKQDFIIGRQKKKLAKQQEKSDEGNDDDETGDDDEIAPEDEAMISKVVSKKFAPIIDKSLADDDEREIQEFLKENTDFKPFEAKVRRFMKHPSRRSLPIKSIFYEVAGDKLLKMGAERAKTADEQARQSQTGGGSNRSEGGKDVTWSLSKEEFEAKQEQIRRGQ